ncbi:MAG: hypothetical protein PHS07_02965 [Patescibacteria group bacterium]|nr:hypothetical protein [Patescibacteria group bacterium]
MLSIKNIFYKNKLLPILLVILFSVTIFSYFQISPTLTDPDSFYHTKMALLMKDQGIIKNFPWLQYTVVTGEKYVDHHLLYHIILIPFITLFPDPLIGIKFSVIILSTLTVLTFYWLLKKLKIKPTWLYLGLLLTASPWLYRMSLAKAQPLSMIILFIGIYCLFKNRPWSLLCLSFIYVWSYGGWILLPFITIIYCLIISLSANYKDYNKFLSETFKNLFAKQKIKLILSTLSGSILGIIINPYFPQNINFYWQQIFKIGILNYGNKISVGMEWYPYNGLSLLYVLIIIMILWIFSFIWSSNQRNKSKKVFSLLFLSIIFCLATLKSGRYVEYFVPLTILAIGYSLNNFWPTVNYKSIIQKIKHSFLGPQRFILSIITIYLIIGMGFFVYFGLVRVIIDTQKNITNGFDLNKFKYSSQWLKDNTPLKSTIFHSCWDEFPALFYHNDQNNYLVGLDPTFMYNYDKNLYWQWENLVWGNPPINTDYKKNFKNNKKLDINDYNLSEIIKNNFNSSYIFLEKNRHIELDKVLNNNAKFILAYEDLEVKIYKIKNAENY